MYLDVLSAFLLPALQVCPQNTDLMLFPARELLEETWGSPRAVHMGTFRHNYDEAQVLMQQMCRILC